jgi:hypothetical protein
LKEEFVRGRVRCRPSRHLCRAEDQARIIDGNDLKSNRALDALRKQESRHSRHPSKLNALASSIFKKQIWVTLVREVVTACELRFKSLDLCHKIFWPKKLHRSFIKSLAGPDSATVGQPINNS